MQGLGEVIDECEAPTLDFIRAAAWAFIQAWVLRYGGLFERLRVSGTLIDPSRNDPTSADMPPDRRAGAHPCTL